MRSRPVHPHGCGENRDATSHAARRFTPTGVGNASAAINCVTPRFTPTGVGNASVHYRTASRSVHPHGCGECDAELASSETADGSPPRVWGNTVTRHWRLDARFTPTGVGNTSCVPGDHRRTVHPHGCGECLSATRHMRIYRFTPTGVGNALDEIDWSRRHGSPPRVWGKRTSGQLAQSSSSVHPHGCGECSPK